ncbi:MAG TPA: NAD(P)H-hydrate dehydratase [Verrucomicrobiae bacterium]|jgi:NAD(P)H-hydrate epimerase
MPVPVISVAQMREWEVATWASGQTETAVIARVGAYLARRALALTRQGDSIVLLAGRGHNGDDVRAMQPHLRERSVRLINVNEPVAALAELGSALQQSPTLIIDGLFGIGLSRPLADDWQRLIAGVNDARCRVLAVDVPSGLDVETGRPLPAAIRATLTITIGAPKRGLLVPSAAAFVGRLEVAEDVGLVPCPSNGELQWTLPKDFAGHPPARPSDGHKGTFGHAAIIAGSIGYHGAAILAARGAQRARPGLITLFTQSEIFAPVAAQLQAVMVQPWRDAMEFSKFTAVLFGPGLAAENLSPRVRECTQELWRTSRLPVIVDASALEWLPREGSWPGAIRVITPHPGEAARLLGCEVITIQNDRAAALRALAKQFNCWVVLKGQHTLIGRAEGKLFVNSSGNADLAQGGSGDLLAGYIAGGLAQPLLQNDPLLTLRHAVFEHGAAADRLSGRRQNWIVEELAQELGRNE